MAAAKWMLVKRRLLMAASRLCFENNQLSAEAECSTSLRIFKPTRPAMMPVKRLIAPVQALDRELQSISGNASSARNQLPGTLPCYRWFITHCSESSACG